MIISYTSWDALTSLYVQAKIYDMSSGTASLVGTYDLTSLKNGTYIYSFAATAGKKYLANIAVFTDGTYTTLDLPNHVPVDYEFSVNSNQTVLTFTAFDASSGLYPQATVYDMSTGSPVLVGTFNLSYLVNGTYYTTAFQADPTKEYAVNISVYTSNTYGTLNSSYTPEDAIIELGDLDPGITNVKSGVTYQVGGLSLTGTYSAFSVSGSGDSAVDAAVDGLATYLAQISGLNVETEWPDSNEAINMPSVTLTAGKDKRTPIQPEQISITSPNSENQVTQVIATAHYDMQIQLDLWCRTKAERRQFLNAILNAFNSSENNGGLTSGLSLQLTSYFNVFARYEIDAHEFRDDEVAAETQERRATIMLVANTRECVSRTMYAIKHATVYQQTDSANSPLTDDTQDTEAKEYF